MSDKYHVPGARAYEVTVDLHLVVIAINEQEAREVVAEVVSENMDFGAIGAARLRTWGHHIPVGVWDPDRELTCTEIADEMES